MEKLALHNRFRDVLIEATGARNQHQGVVETVWGPEIGWVIYERICMLTAVNVARAERGYPPVDIEAVRRADQYATGHVDWLDKFSLYCAELTLDSERRT
jgi:hypothetical protein